MVMYKTNNCIRYVLRATSDDEVYSYSIIKLHHGTKIYIYTRITLWSKFHFNMTQPFNRQYDKTL